MSGRRNFIKKGILISGGFGAYLLGCTNKSEDPTPGGILPNPGGTPGPTPTKTPWDNYIPVVNSTPYFKRDYFNSEDVSDNMGKIDFSHKGTEIYGAWLETTNHNPIKGLVARFFAEDRNGARMVSIEDPQKNYLPVIYSFVKGLGGRIQSPFLTLFSAEEEGVLGNGGLGSSLKKIYIREIKDSLPSFYADKMCDYPGRGYLGDWSFNQAKKLNTNLNKASATITLAAPNPVSPKIFAVTSTIGTVLEGIDFVIDSLNHFANLNINKDREYPIYQLPFGTSNIIISLGSQSYCANQKEEIKDLFPLQPGNSWTFKDGKGNSDSLECKGTISVKGKDLIQTRNVFGQEEYFGFYNQSLYYHGIKDPSIGRIFFEPAIKLGDEKIGAGSVYNTSSKIISESHSNITGTYKSDWKYSKREKIVLPNGKPYGDCFKVEESDNFELKNNTTGDTSSSDAFVTHWFARNVGKVKMDFSGEGVYLDEFSFDGISSGRVAMEGDSFFMNPSVQKIIDATKFLIK